jgi:hypothetical protein
MKVVQEWYGNTEIGKHLLLLRENRRLQACNPEPELTTCAFCKSPGSAFEGSNPSPATSITFDLPIGRVLTCGSFASRQLISGVYKIRNGHEFQHQAPANWTATLHRGGVLRVKTRPIATNFGKRGSN